MAKPSKFSQTSLACHSGYPNWICVDCGVKHGRIITAHPTMHYGDRCGWCGDKKATTEPRDFGRPAMIEGAKQ